MSAEEIHKVNSRIIHKTISWLIEDHKSTDTFKYRWYHGDII